MTEVSIFYSTTHSSPNVKECSLMDWISVCPTSRVKFGVFGMMLQPNLHGGIKWGKQGQAGRVVKRLSPKVDLVFES